MEIAIFGGGCFWCTEAVFRMLRGVHSVMPGYAGGATAAPTHAQVSQGSTGHAEVIRVEFNPSVISYNDLLTVFFASHDPTTVNRQGNDVGTQYRSIILTTTPEQAECARAFIAELGEEGGNPIVTEVRPLDTFTPAEPEHQQYYERNTDQPYCQVIIEPKVRKMQEKFKELLNRQ
ncbi:MAG: peptide-methionine (S)-S-oxide reductase MsrA [bacterium]|nr:peptide-methionine (S)-S-oxide reductase MsrA [bacterium]